MPSVPVAFLFRTQALAAVVLLASACAAGEPAFLPDRVIIKLKPGKGVAALKAKQTGSKTFAGLDNIEVLSLQPGSDVKKAIAEIKASGLVEYAEPDYIVRLVDMPNDPGFQDGTLWGLHNTGQNGGVADADIDAPEGWEIRNASPNVVVAVIDTGIRYTHEDLAPNMWVNPGEIAGNRIDDDGNGIVDDIHGFNAITRTGDPKDDNGHGSHCAGTIGAAGHNSRGVVGVTRSVKFMACKFLDSSGSGTTSAAIECINYARQKGAHIMSNSWGGGGFSQALQDAINAAAASGILFVAAAGNYNFNNDYMPHYPSSYPCSNIIAVAATTRTDSLASYSSYGATTVDLGAPGSDVYSCVHSADNAYGFKSGTSMATPHVAGACALLKAHFPSYTHQQLIQRLLDNVDPLSALAGRCVSKGRLNLYKALFTDLIPPSVAIDQAAFQKDPTRTRPIRFSVVFSEPVTGFDQNDLSIAGLTPLSVTVNGKGTTFNVEIQHDNPGSGTVTVTIPAGAAQDLSGNLSLASTSTDNSVTFSPQGVCYWTGGSLASNHWSDPENWGGTAPAEGDTLFFHGPSLRNVADNDFPPGTEFGNLSLDGGFTLTGKAIAIHDGSVRGNTGTNAIQVPLILTGATTVTAGAGSTLNISAPASWTLTGYDLELQSQAGSALNMHAPIGGNGRVRLTGPGLLALHAPNDYSGTTWVSSGTTTCGAPGVLSPSTALQLDGTLDISAGDQTVGVVLGSGTVRTASPRTLTIGGATNWWLGCGFSGPVSLAKAGTGQVGVSLPSTFVGSLRIDQGALLAQGAGGLGGDGGGVEVRATGAALWLHPSFVPSGSKPLSLNGTGIGSRGALEYFGNTGVWNSLVTLTGPASIGVFHGRTSLEGGIAGAYALTKAGPGTLLVSGANAYGGPFILAAGGLGIQGDCGNAPVWIAVPGTVLEGIGRCGGIEASAGAILPQGGSTGTFQVNGPLSLTGSASLAIQVNGTGANQFDSLAVTGPVSLGGTLNVSTGSTLAPGATFRILENDLNDAVLGTFLGLTEGAIVKSPWQRFSLSYQGGTGNDVVLTALSNPKGLSDDFDPNLDALQWFNLSAVANTNFAPAAPAAVNNSAFFDGDGTRQAQTAALDCTAGGAIRFSLIFGSGSFPEDADSGEDVVLEFSTNGGASYTVMATYMANAYISWTPFTIPLPTAAQTSGTIFRWRQVLHSGSGFDHWALDNVLIGPGSPPTISDIPNQNGNEDAALGPLSFSIGDADTPTNTLTLSATSSNPALVPNAGIALAGSGSNRTVLLTPAADGTGSSTITVAVSDGVFSIDDSFVVTFADDNTPPIITPIGSQTVVEDSTSGPIAFSIGDAQTPADRLSLAVSSSNSELLPVDGIVLGGRGVRRTLTITPGANRVGTGTITLSALDDGAPDTTPSGSSTSFSVTVADDNTPPTVSAIPPQSGYDGQSMGPIPFVIGDAETPVGSLSVSATSSNQALIPNSSIQLDGVGGTRSLTLHPAVGLTGSALITVEVQDDGAPDIQPGRTTTVSFTAIIKPSPVLFGPAFRILTLGTSGANVVDVSGLAGDDCGGIAVSGSKVFYSGDASTVRYDLSGLGNGEALGFVRYGLACNFRAGKAYLLGNGATPLGSGGGIASTLLELDGTSGAPNGTSVTLSTPINLPYGSGIFSGYDRIVLYTGSRVYNVALPTGAVTDLGVVSLPGYAFSESWAFWGIAEYFGGSVHLVYVRDNTTIARTQVGSGATTTLQAFSNLGDMASIAFATSNSRWYFHYESNSQFGIVSEALGYADATWDSPSGTAPTITALPGFTITEDKQLGPLSFGVNDLETPNALTVTASSSNPALVPNGNLVLGGAGTSRTIALTPVRNAFGSASITLSVSDGAFTATSSFVLQVLDDNTPPALSVPSTAVSLNVTSGPVSIPFTIDDAQTPVSNLQVTVQSSSALLLPPERLALSGSGRNRVLTITPSASTGLVQVILSVKDNGAPDTAPYTASVSLTVTLHRGAAYLRSNTSNPFGNSSNAAAMDRVFGAGAWSDLRFETLDPLALFSSDYAFVFMEGGEYTALEMEQFVNHNRTTMEQWVSGGGALFLTSAGYEGNGLTAPFGVSLSVGSNSDQAEAADANHPIFNGPFLPAYVSSYSGTLAAGQLEGGDLTVLLRAPSLSRVLLAEKAAGSGRVLYGTLTPDHLHTPQPHAANLRANILAYAASGFRRFEVTGYPSPAPPGVQRPFTVRAQDIFGRIDTGFSGALRFTSSDANAVLPADGLFRASDRGEKQFMAAFSAPGTYSLSATGLSGLPPKGTLAGIVVSANTSPSLANLSLTRNVLEGGKIALAGRIVDPDSGQTFTLEVAWGDGAQERLALPVGANDFQLEHLCRDDAESAVQVVLTDSGGGQAEGAAPYSVRNVPPVLAIQNSGGAIVGEGASVQLSALVVDPGVADTHLLRWLVTREAQTVGSGEGERFQFTPVKDGPYLITLIARDDDGGVGTATLLIHCNGVPQFASELAATPNPAKPGQAVRFSCTVTDSDSLALFWDFGDGTSDPSNTQTPVHAFSAAGVFTVTVTAADTQGQKASKSISVVVERPGGVSGAGGSEPDSDGDGFSDALEIAAGTSPDAFAYTPTGAPAGPALSLADTRLAVRLRFGTSGQDRLVLSGTLVYDQAFQVSDQPVVVDVGGIARLYTLDAKGKGRNASGTLVVKGKASGAGYQTLRFLWRGKGDFADQLADEGLANLDTVNARLRVGLTVLLDGELFQAVQEVKYSAIQGQSGKAR